MPGKTNDVMKIALAACLGALITGATAWIAFGQGVVSKDYLERFDRDYSSWAKDKDVVTERMNRISENNVEALKLIKEVQEQQKAIQKQLETHLQEVKWKKEYGIEKKK